MSHSLDESNICEDTTNNHGEIASSDESIENSDGTNGSNGAASGNIAEDSSNAKNCVDSTSTAAKPSIKQDEEQIPMPVVPYRIGRKKVENFFSFQTFADCYGCQHISEEEPSEKLQSNQITRNALKDGTITTVTLSTSVKTKKDFLKSIKRSKIVKRVRHVLRTGTKLIISK